MAINKDSNVYTIFFAFILVVVVGGLLAFVSVKLKPLQQENLKNEKKQNILNSIPELKAMNIERKDAGVEYEKYVKKRMILDHNGDVIEGTLKTDSNKIIPKDQTDAFNIDLLKQYRNKDLKDEEKKYPMFICEVKDDTYYVIPVMGKGLWDAIWGFISVEEDKTIVGAIFDHKSETPGLGAEINRDKFEFQFDKEKRIEKKDPVLKIGRFVNSKFKSIAVVKPGNIRDKSSEVDGISGGTFTSVGVEEMIERTMLVYYKYFDKINN